MTTDPADLTHLVLLKVAEFIRRLPADQLADLADGSAKLELVPKGGRPAARATAARTAAPLALAPDKVREELAAIGDRGAGVRYVTDLRLTVAQLKALATALGIAVPGKATKAQAVDTIVEWTVGRRLDSESISRPAPARG